MTTNIIKDLSTLTKINESVFNKLKTKIDWCICDTVDKSIKNGDTQADINLGIGVLRLDWTTDRLRYSFFPSKNLENSLVKTIEEERNDLVLNIENSLVSKLTNVYKSFF